MLPSIGEIRLTDLLDVAIVAGLLWLGIAWLQTTRTRLALLGLGFLGVLYLVVQQLQFRLTSWLLQGFFAVVVIVIVVVFQDDLRRLFERIALLGLRRRAPRPAPDMIDTLVDAVNTLAQSRHGALIVLPGREPLQRHMEGGTYLRGRASKPLLLSLFDPHSAGHDGAVILQGNLISRFSVHLPLSTDWDRIGPGGTRHAAALGLAERTDALCVVVSEERGTVSLARSGELTALARGDDLRDALQRFIAESDTGPQGRLRLSILRSVAGQWREGLTAVGLAAVLWLLSVPGATLSHESRAVPVIVENLPEGYELVGVDPPEVEVTFSGLRRDLYLANPGQLKVQIDALLVQLGRRTFQVGPEQVSHPKTLTIAALEPTRVKLSVRREDDAADAEEPEGQGEP